MKQLMDDLIDAREIAEMLGVSRAHCVGRLIKRPSFPQPVINVSRRLRKWRRADVLKWASTAAASR
ncbi:MAG: hypothetical protein N2690_03380 [Rhodocyclaceae bacterium]|nr:hypothetical protein [Rhodocyclaceae bacterium]